MTLQIKVVSIPNFRNRIVKNTDNGRATVWCQISISWNASKVLTNGRYNLTNLFANFLMKYVTLHGMKRIGIRQI